MKFSYDAAWQDMIQWMRAHADLLLVITGAFLFLPMFAQALFFTQPQITEFDAESMEAIGAYFQRNFLPIFALRLVILVGIGALLALVLSPDRPTVGGAISRAGRLLPSLFLADILSQLLVIAGVIALIIPGLYLIARTAVTTPVIMAEQIGNPFRAIGRSLALTKGMGWRIFLFIALVAVLVLIAGTAFSAVVGILSQLILPEAGAKIATELLSALSSTAFTFAMTLVTAAIYRQGLTQHSNS